MNKLVILFFIILLSCSNEAVQEEVEVLVDDIEVNIDQPINLKALNSKIEEFTFINEGGYRALDSSIYFNETGLDLYNKADYENARKEFEKAIYADSSHLYPHYNLACMLSLLYGSGQKIDEKEIIDEILIALTINEMDPSIEPNWVRNRLSSDSDFEPLQDFDWFNELKEVIINPINISEFVVGTWADSYNTLKLFEDGTFTFDGLGSASGNWIWDDVNGIVLETETGSLVCSRDTTIYLENGLNHSCNEIITTKPYAEIVLFNSSDTHAHNPVRLILESETIRDMYEDTVKMTQLIMLNFVPSYYEDDFSPIITAIEQSHSAIIRLLLGKEHLWPLLSIEEYDIDSELLETITSYKWNNKYGADTIAHLTAPINGKLYDAFGKIDMFDGAGFVVVGGNEHYLAYLDYRSYEYFIDDIPDISFPTFGLNIIILDIKTGKIVEKVSVLNRNRILFGRHRLFDIAMQNEGAAYINYQMAYNAETIWLDIINQYDITLNFPKTSISQSAYIGSDIVDIQINTVPDEYTSAYHVEVLKNQDHYFLMEVKGYSVEYEGFFYLEDIPYLVLSVMDSGEMENIRSVRIIPFTESIMHTSGL